MPWVPVLVNGNWILKVIFYNFPSSPKRYSYFLFLSLHLGGVELGKFFPSTMGSRPHFNRDVQHGLAWLTAAHMLPGVWIWYCSTSGIMEIGTGVSHLKTLATVHAVDTENVFNTRTMGLFHSTCWAIDQINNGAATPPVCHWNTGRLLWACVWQKPPRASWGKCSLLSEVSHATWILSKHEQQIQQTTKNCHNFQMTAIEP